MGKLLSSVLFPILGISVLLLREQLRDGRLWRCDSPLKLADFRADREHYRRVDVRDICKSSVFDRHAAPRA